MHMFQFSNMWSIDTSQPYWNLNVCKLLTMHSGICILKPKGKLKRVFKLANHRLNITGCSFHRLR